MPTQQELDDAVITAAQQLSQQLLLLDTAAKQQASFQAQKDDATTNLQTAKVTTRSRRDDVKTGAVSLNNAIIAANAGPTP